jgi:hypothetical protein
MKTKKRIFGVCLVLAALMLAGCENPNDGGGDSGGGTVAVESVTLSETEKALEPGGEFELTAVIEPSDADDQTVTWASSDDEVVTVEGTGLTVTINAAGPGNADITVTTTDGEKTAQCAVSVSPPPLPLISAQGVLINQPNIGAEASAPDPDFLDLVDGRWTAEAGTVKSFTNHTGTASGSGGTGRASLFFIKQPLTRAYTFRAKISFPPNSAGSVIFGEFINPEAAADTETTPTNFQNSPAGTGNTSGAVPGYKGIAGIRFPPATAAGTGTVNAYGWANGDLALAGGTLTTLLGTDKPWLQGVTPAKTCALEGYVPETAHTFELSWSREDGYAYKIIIGDEEYELTYPLIDVWAAFDTRPETDPIYPGIMIYNNASGASGRKITINISEVELVWN